MIRGEHLARVRREFRGMKGADLARVTGVSASCPSDLEAGCKSGSARTFMCFAETLRIDSADASEPAVPRRFRVVRLDVSLAVASRSAAAYNAAWTTRKH